MESTGSGRRRARRTFADIRSEGRKPIGAFIFSNDPSTTAIFASAGYDWVVVDTEHGMMDPTTVVGHVRAAESRGAVPIVRVLRNDTALIQQALDMGAQGVLVPKIGSADEAASAVAASLYQPGGRGMCPVVPGADYTIEGWSRYRDEVNDNVVLLPLIETRAGIDNLAEIAAVDGVDHIFFGLADLSQDLGIDMLGDADALVRIWKEVVEIAHAHSVFVGAPLGYGFDEDIDFGTLSGDLDLLSTQARAALAKFKVRYRG